MVSLRMMYQWLRHTVVMARTMVIITLAIAEMTALIPLPMAENTLPWMNYCP